MEKTGVSDENCKNFLILTHKLIPYNIDNADKMYKFAEVVKSVQNILDKRFRDKIGIKEYFEEQCQVKLAESKKKKIMNLNKFLN